MIEKYISEAELNEILSKLLEKSKDKKFKDVNVELTEEVNKKLRSMADIFLDD